MAPKSGQVDDQRQADALPAEAGVEVALEPVVGRAVAVALDRLAVVRFLDVEEHAGPEHPVDAQDLRAVRVVGGFALGVVLAVDRCPLLGDHAGGQPQPEAEEM